MTPGCRLFTAAACRPRRPAPRARYDPAGAAGLSAPSSPAATGSTSQACSTALPASRLRSWPQRRTLEPTLGPALRARMTAGRAAASRGAPSLYVPLARLLVRAPLLPVETYLALEAEPGATAQASTRDALTIRSCASPWRSAAPTCSRGSTRATRTPTRGTRGALERTLLRYLIRMSTRATPYGLFAGVAIASDRHGDDVGARRRRPAHPHAAGHGLAARLRRAARARARGSPPARASSPTPPSSSTATAPASRSVLPSTAASSPRRSPYEPRPRCDARSRALASRSPGARSRTSC